MMPVRPFYAQNAESLPDPIAGRPYFQQTFYILATV